MCQEINNHTAGTVSSELNTKLGHCLEVRTSRAFSAFVSVITPTAAFAASIIKITCSAKIKEPGHLLPAGHFQAMGYIQFTEGSKKADNPVSPFIRAKRNEITAAAINILTSKSSNCFKTNFQKGVPGYEFPYQKMNSKPYMKLEIARSKHNWEKGKENKM